MHEAARTISQRRGKAESFLLLTTSKLIPHIHYYIIVYSIFNPNEKHLAPSEQVGKAYTLKHTYLLQSLYIHELYCTYST